MNNIKTDNNTNNQMKPVEPIALMDCGQATKVTKGLPIFWWAERSHISKSIGPFLRKRMLETHTFCSLIEMQPIADKQTRAQSIQGRLSMNRVRFPERAPWWPAARDQMLKFPYDAHDDFVDTLAYIGLGLTLQIGAGAPKRDPDDVAENTFGWLKLQRDQAERSVKLGFGAGGW